MRAAVAQWLPQAQMPEMLTQLISCAWDEAASPFPREGTLHIIRAAPAPAAACLSSCSFWP